MKLYKVRTIMESESHKEKDVIKLWVRGREKEEKVKPSNIFFNAVWICDFIWKKRSDCTISLLLKQYCKQPPQNLVA